MSRGIALVAAAAVLIATAITLWLSAGAATSSRPTATESMPRTAASSMPRTAASSMPRTAASSMPRTAASSVPEAHPSTPGPSKTASSTTLPSTSPATPDITAPPAAEAQQLSDPSMQALLDQTVPSTVTGSTAQEVITIATAVQVADLSGVGRELWPTYFGGEPPTDVYSDVHIHAATARWKGAGKGFVVVALMWSATAPTGSRTSVATIAITLAWNGAHRIPVHTTAS